MIAGTQTAQRIQDPNMEPDRGTAGATTRRRTPQLEDPEFRRPCVLVVEDDAHDREIYGRILCYNGFDVMFAGTGHSGLGLAARYRPDLILLDMGLPDVPGLDVCTRLRAWRATASVPVVVLSAFAEAVMGARARAAGCALYMEKPASPVAVLHAVESFIGKAPLAGVGRPPRMIEPV
jgi:DNA-binding response OmpR family regulator